MSLGKFIWRTIWQDAGNLARIIKLFAVTLPALATIIVASLGGAWSKDRWPWWVWAILTGVAVIVVLLFSFARRAYLLEQALEPKIRIIGPTTHAPGGSTGKTIRTMRIEVENITATTLTNCCVREAKFVNRFGDKSGMRRHFRLSEETFADMESHTYRKTFNLQGRGSKEIIDIAQLDETKSDSRVLMLYATEPTASTLNAIVRDCFPHRLTISVTADNLPISQERTYDLKISADGILEMAACVKSA